MQLTLSNNDAILGGTLAPINLNLPAGSITDSTVQAAAGVQASKLQQQPEKCRGQSGTAVAERRAVHITQGTTCAALTFQAGAATKAIGNATVTVDLQANGVSLLTAALTLDSTVANYALVTGTFTAGAATIAKGSVIEIVITTAVGTGTLPAGVFAQVTLREAAQ